MKNPNLLNFSLHQVNLAKNSQIEMLEWIQYLE